MSAICCNCNEEIRGLAAPYLPVSKHCEIVGVAYAGEWSAMPACVACFQIYTALAKDIGVGDATVHAVLSAFATTIADIRREMRDYRGALIQIANVTRAAL